MCHRCVNGVEAQCRPEQQQRADYGEPRRVDDLRRQRLYGPSCGRGGQAQGLNPVLAGRRAGPIEKLATELSVRARVFDLDDPPSLTAALADIAVVANCAGPFAATSAPMIDACLKNQTHYLDITGEIDVFLAAHRRHIEAKTAGIVICPGVGFDVIPTDCMAATLKEALPDATHLVLAFDAGGSMSPGTARTMAQSMRLGQRGGRVRRSGVIEEIATRA